MTDQEIFEWLQKNNSRDLERLFRKAYAVKEEIVKKTVYFRGIIELSNICEKNCFYCGIRKDVSVNRYCLTRKEILQCAEFAFANDYGSLVLQAGERKDDAYIRFINETITQIKALSEGRLGITLSLGEQSYDVYKKWFDLGAHRYLLRIETSSETLYQRLHPADHSFHNRIQCLRDLKTIGYQVGTGVMIGLPHQKIEDLVRDIRFFSEYDIDMIGMGPYIPQERAPLSTQPVDLDLNFILALKMIALTRIVMPDINIAATTALQALDPNGREKALKAGANILMPNITPQQYRADYQLYNDKPCIEEEPLLCLGCLESRIKSLGETIGYDQWGDSIHFEKRSKK